VETEPTHMCELRSDLLGVNILGVEGKHREQVTIHFDFRCETVGCPAPCSSYSLPSPICLTSLNDGDLRGLGMSVATIR